MKFSAKTITRITFLGATLMWIISLLADATITFSLMQNLPAGIPAITPKVFFMAYILFAFYYLVWRIEKNESLSFTDLLWKVFISGMLAVIISLGVRTILVMMGSSKLLQNPVFTSILIQINLGLFTNLILIGLVSWKRLIMYQKSKVLIRIWQLFTVLLAFLLVISFLFPIDNSQWNTIALGALGLVILILSSNVRWIVYLNFKQKWTGLLLILLIFFYLTYFTYTLINYFGAIQNIIPNYSGLYFTTPFIIGLTAFIAIYALFSFLVILFNLPTSSAFQQKIEEATSFQRLSQSIQTEQNEKSVYTILLESAVNAGIADAAWVDIIGKNTSIERHTQRISDIESRHISPEPKQVTEKNRIPIEWVREEVLHLKPMKGHPFRSLLSLPIQVKNDVIGRLVVLKELPKGFNKEMIRIVSTFANQAGISIENFRLLEEAFQNERYKEELKIAKKVQRSLLPQHPITDPYFEMHTFSQSADEVGGDYYDALRLSDHQIAWIIADVSGKGTTAAFNMSQMKGIFHTLTQLKYSPKEFMITANQALKNCLEKSSFISAAYFVIDTQKKHIAYTRAGHCPILFFNHKTKKSYYLEDKGTALGLIRNDTFNQTVHMYDIEYHPDDVMVLYTDGITEASNKNGDEFGYERLSSILVQIAHRSPKEIQEYILDKVYAFSGSDRLNDDYTMVIIKFSHQPNLTSTV